MSHLLVTVQHPHCGRSGNHLLYVHQEQVFDIVRGMYDGGVTEDYLMHKKRTLYMNVTIVVIRLFLSAVSFSQLMQYPRSRRNLRIVTPEDTGNETRRSTTRRQTSKRSAFRRCGGKKAWACYIDGTHGTANASMWGSRRCKKKKPKTRHPLTDGKLWD